MRKLIVLLSALLLLAASGCGDDKKDSRDSGGGDEAGDAAPVGPQTAPQASNGCETVEAPKAKPDGGEKKPKDDLDASKT